MAPRVDPVASDDTLPARTGVVVIGGGIIGTCTAFFLAKKGVPVVLCEKGHIAGEQSSRNWGWVRKMGRDPRELPLAIEALRLWGGLNEEIGAETGFRRCGIMFLCKTQADLAERAAWLEAAQPYQLDTRLLTHAEAAEKLPGLTGEWAGALYTESDGRGEPQMAAPAIAEAARRLGAGIVTQCAVRGIETKGGKISGVVTEKGRIACDAVVLAGGAWSSLFCASLGIRLPQLKVLSSVMRTAPIAEGPDPCTYMDAVGYRKRRDGGYTIARGAGYVAPLVPDSLRYLRDFLPTIRKERDSLRLRVNAQSLREFRAPRHWPLDRPSPFEATRVLDPMPNRALN